MERNEQLPPTYFASPERASRAELLDDVLRALQSPVIDALLRTCGGAVALIDRHRQIVSTNLSFLELMGVDRPGEALGLRPGEALSCVHAQDHPAGCGTGRVCATCGAALAVVSALGSGAAQERECALTVERGGQRAELALLVRAVPVCADPVLLLLVMTDISGERRRAALERSFRHQLANLVTALNGAASELRAGELASPEVVGDVHAVAGRLGAELALVRAIAAAVPEGTAGNLGPVEAAEVLGALEGAAAEIASSRGKVLRLRGPTSGLGSVYADLPLLVRVLSLLLENAFEATPLGGEVWAHARSDPDAVTFSVGNAGVIPPGARERIFQRFFTTKPGGARGQGTFLAKLLAEQLLAAQIGFESTQSAGTIFWVRLPRAGAPEANRQAG